MPLMYPRQKWASRLRLLFELSLIQFSIFDAQEMLDPALSEQLSSATGLHGLSPRVRMCIMSNEGIFSPPASEY